MSVEDIIARVEKHQKKELKEMSKNNKKDRGRKLAKKAEGRRNLTIGESLVRSSIVGLGAGLGATYILAPVFGVSRRQTAAISMALGTSAFTTTMITTQFMEGDNMARNMLGELAVNSAVGAGVAVVALPLFRGEGFADQTIMGTINNAAIGGMATGAGVLASQLLVSADLIM